MDFDFWTTFFSALAIILVVRILLSRRKVVPEEAKFHVGDVTLDGLRLHSGYDYMRPTLCAIKGEVFDVTNSYDLFAPGKPLHVYAGREVSRALALESLAEHDCSDDLQGLGDQELARLAAAQTEYRAKYDCVGRVVPLAHLTLAQLAAHDGSDPARPLYVSIRGTVYDVSKGRQFYGPDGVYPFAGREVARAFALYSTDLADCNDRVDDLSYSEKEALREWIAKFQSKYPIVGRMVAAEPLATSHASGADDGCPACQEDTPVTAAWVPSPS